MSFILYAAGNQLTVWQREPITSGSVCAYQVLFKFSADWDGMTKIACFRAGTQTVSLALDASNKCTVPWEVIGPDSRGKNLQAGVYGTYGGTVVLPTVWTSLGNIYEGVSCGQNALPPAPNVWEQLLEQKQDKLTGLSGQFAGFDENGKLTALDAPSSEEGTAQYLMEMCTASDRDITEMLNEVFETPLVNNKILEEQ